MRSPASMDRGPFSPGECVSANAVGPGWPAASARPGIFRKPWPLAELNSATSSISSLTENKFKLSPIFTCQCSRNLLNSNVSTTDGSGRACVISALTFAGVGKSDTQSDVWSETATNLKRLCKTPSSKPSPHSCSSSGGPSPPPRSSLLTTLAVAPRGRSRPMRSPGHTPSSGAAMISGALATHSITPTSRKPAISMCACVSIRFSRPPAGARPASWRAKI